MRAFQLPAKTQAKLVKATPHKEFEGKNPTRQAISLRMRATISLQALRQISPNLPEMLVRRRDDADVQKPVDGVPPVVLERLAPEVALPLNVDGEFTGYTVNLDRAMGDIELYGCKLSRFKINEVIPEGEHGMAEFEWSIGSDEKITPELVGALCGMEAGDVWLGQKAPDKPAHELEKAKKANRKQEAQEAAGQQRIDAQTPESALAASLAAEGGAGGGDPEPDDDGSGHPDASAAQQSKAKLDASGRSPFPAGGAKTDGELAASREAQLQAEAAAGAATKGGRRQRKAVAGAVE